MKLFGLFLCFALILSMAHGVDTCMSCQWAGTHPYCFPDTNHWSNEDSDCRSEYINNVPRCMEWPNLACDQGWGVPVP